MQRVLARRKHELESQLARARGSDFITVRTDVVSPGTVIRVTDLATQEEITYEILGAWDGEPEQNRLSYLTPLAQIFVGKPAGAEVAFNGEAGSRKFRIESIAQVKRPPSDG